MLTGTIKTPLQKHFPGQLSKDTKPVLVVVGVDRVANNPVDAAPGTCTRDAFAESVCSTSGCSGFHTAAQWHSRLRGVSLGQQLLQQPQHAHGLQHSPHSRGFADYPPHTQLEMPALSPTMSQVCTPTSARSQKLAAMMGPSDQPSYGSRGAESTWLIVGLCCM